MRTRMWLISIPLLATAFGVAAAGCGDDTSPTTPTGDASGSSSSGGSSGSSSGVKDSSTTDAPKEAARDSAPAACVDAAINVATFDSGSASWGCYQKNCTTGNGNLPACAADCTCNTAFATALACVADGGDTTACFTPAVTGGGDGGLQWYMGCFMMNMTTCGGGPPPDGGDAGDGEAAPPGDSGGDTSTVSDAADSGG
jgi:hypothetical protein